MTAPPPRAPRSGAPLVEAVRRALRPAHPLQLALGLTLWAAWFGAVYGAASLACAPAAPPWAAQPWVGGLPVVNVALLALTALTVALLAWGARRCWRASGHLAGTAGPLTGDSRFVARTAALLYAVGAVATVFVALPLLVVPPCV